MYVRPQGFKYLLAWIIGSMRGGVTRAQIITALEENPQNANQLAALMCKDYRTIRHHLRVLEKNRMVMSAGDGYGTTYFLSREMEENYTLFEEMFRKVLERKAREQEK